MSLTPQPWRAASDLGEIRSLTTLRFFAALAVVLFHHAQFAVRDMAPWTRTLIGNGGTGATLFFVLSGFILVYVYEGRTCEGRVNARDFYLRRFARIYPVYFLAWLLTGALLWSDWIKAGAIVWLAKATVFFGSLSALLLQGWVPSAAPAWNWPGWSLSVEAFFYALFPLLFWLIRKLPSRGLWPSLVGVAILNLLVALGVSLLTAWTPVIAADSAIAAPAEEFLGALPILRLPQFLMGSIAGHIFVRGLLPRATSRAWGTATLAIVAAILLFLSGVRSVVADPVLRSVLTAAYTLLILFLAASDSKRRKRSRLESGFIPTAGTLLNLLGQASYAIYILQTPIWRLFCMAAGSPLNGEKEVGFVVTYVFVLIAASVIVYLAFERPTEKWIKSTYGTAMRNRTDPRFGRHEPGGLRPVHSALAGGKLGRS